MNKTTPVGNLQKIRDQTISKSMGNVTIKRCTKFNPFYKGLPDNQSAMVFLRLRQEGCQKKTAVNFARRVVCRYDITKQNDGPSTHRTLKIREQKQAVTINVLNAVREYPSDFLLRSDLGLGFYNTVLYYVPEVLLVCERLHEDG